MVDSETWNSIRGRVSPRFFFREFFSRALLSSYRFSSADQNTFYIYWFLIKPQNVKINRIHFHTFGGGLISGEAVYYFIFCLQRGGPMAGGGGGGARGPYQCRSLEAAVYVKWPILFSTFNMISD